jgi:hypothetical protein
MIETLPPCILLAWETISGDPSIGQMLYHFTKLPSDNDFPKVIRHELFNKMDWMSAEEQRAHGRALLSGLLMQAMLQIVSNTVHARTGVEFLLETPKSVLNKPSDRIIDSDYLALLMLVFIVFHEIGHSVLDHNALEPEDMPMDSVYREISNRMETYATKHSDTIFNFQNLMDTVISHEIAADKFAIQAVGDLLRHPLLEAATLWCTALEAADESREDWLEKFSAGKPGAHPPFMARVWQLNGLFSEDARKGWPAQEITRRAQSMVNRVGSELLSVEGLARLFPVLWQIALKEIR